MRKEGFTLIELLAVIIVLAIILVLTIPNVLKSMDKAKDEALITYAKKVTRTAQDYIFVHQDEFQNSQNITKNINEIMGSTGTYTGYVTINKDGTSTYSINVKNENRSLCNISSNTTITSTNITRAPSCIQESGQSDQDLVDYANALYERALNYVNNSEDYYWVCNNESEWNNLRPNNILDNNPNYTINYLCLYRTKTYDDNENFAGDYGTVYGPDVCKKDEPKCICSLNSHYPFTTQNIENECPHEMSS